MTTKDTVTIPPPPPKKGKGSPPAATEASNNNTEKPSTKALVPHNFAVSAEFKKAYKIAATEYDMSMVDLLKESFDIYKKYKAGLLIDPNKKD
jgi:hypothetical protein